MSGITLSGNVNFGDNDITNVDSLDADKFSIAGGTEMTGISASDSLGTSDTTLPTQGAVKAYVDANAGGGVPSQITVADESSDTTCFPMFSVSATGDIEPKTGSNLTFNSATGTLEATGIRGTIGTCLLYTSPSPRDVEESRMPSSA